MANPSNDPLSDDQIERLVQFDESLRLGRDPARREPAPDPDVDQAQQFLRRLQTVWKR